MTTDISVAATERVAARGGAVIRSDDRLLRRCVIASGISCAVLFVVIGLRYELQLYADGSMFSYAVAAQDVWAFHWHNISGRLFVYLAIDLPAQVYVALTHDARGGIIVYGFLFFAFQLLGLAATWAADRSRGHLIFTYACASTACLCPLVFGFPTEMWVAHALFWPALAVCHYARDGIPGAVLVFAMLLALVFTHEAALVLAVVILTTLVLRGTGNPVFLRAAGALLLVMSIWTLVKAALPPDSYDAPMMRRAALNFFDLTIFRSYILLLLLGALATYGGVLLFFRWWPGPAQAHEYAALLVTMALAAAYWLWFDRALHGNQRYPMRTVLLIATAALGMVAAAYALAAEGRLNLPIPILPQLLAALADGVVARAIAGAFLVVMLVHAVETAKFVKAWTDYKDAVVTLAMGAASDPKLGDARFVSSDRIDDDRNRLSWFSTTPYLSVLLAPGFAPARLVVDPKGNYFWLSCKTAAANYRAERAVPTDSRRLVHVYACLHR